MLIRGAGGAGPALPQLGRRLRWIVLVVLLVLGGLIARLWQLQVVRGDTYRQRTVSNVVHQRFLPSVRGKILDRHGVPLAANRPAFNIYVTPRSYDDGQAAELRRLLGLTEEEVAAVAERVAEGKQRAPRAPVIVLADQGRDRAALIQQAGFRLPGVEVRHEPYRDYPNGDLAAHLIGYMTQMTASELERLEPQGYEASELVGRYGLELEWENYLRGQKGIERYAVDARGQRIDDHTAAGLIEGDRITEPVAGYNVVLTLDAELQRLAEKAVAPFAAAAVAVVDVHSGAILALVSRPSFDPATMTGRLTRAEEALLTSDPRKPFMDKTLRAQYPPGSTFKFVTAIAALEDGLGNEDEPMVCNGSYEISGTSFDCTSSHGKLDLLGAIQHSCNVYFWHLAERIGIDRIAEVSRDYGFGAPTGLGLNGDSAGRIPTKQWYEQRGRFKIGYTINAATGQGDVELTVMQLVMAYAALANRGTLLVPQVVERVEAGDGRVVVAYQPKVNHKVSTSPEILDLLHRGMWKVVNEAGGTDYDHGRSDVVVISGKTGTAQSRAKSKQDKSVDISGWHPGRDHAWFGGWAPAADPQVAIVVLIEHGGSGGKIAGPVARTILEGWARLADQRNGVPAAPSPPVAPSGGKAKAKPAAGKAAKKPAAAAPAVAPVAPAVPVAPPAAGPQGSP